MPRRHSVLGPALGALALLPALSGAAYANGVAEPPLGGYFEPVWFVSSFLVTWWVELLILREAWRWQLDPVGRAELGRTVLGVHLVSYPLTVVAFYALAEVSRSALPLAAEVVPVLLEPVLYRRAFATRSRRAVAEGAPIDSPVKAPSSRSIWQCALVANAASVLAVFVLLLALSFLGGFLPG